MLKEVTVIIEGLIGFYTLEPLMRELMRRNVKLHVYCRHKPRDTIEKTFPELSGQLNDLDEPFKRFRMVRYLQRILLLFATRKNFSSIYSLRSHPKQRRENRLYSFSYWLSRMIPGLPNNAVNRSVARIISPFISNIFPTNRIIVYSYPSAPHLFCAAGQEIITLMESWDQPVKRPAGYLSKLVYCWNRDLCEDWQANQGDVEVKVGYPWKLRYWLESYDQVATIPKEAKPLVVYAVGTSSFNKIGHIFQQEQKIIAEVCEATRRIGWRLHIKPKPNGPQGEYDTVASNFDHVTIGAYKTVEDTSDYYLDDAYNRNRSQELKNCALVINTFTTFGLDAALMGYPVLQLDFRDNANYGEIGNFQTNYHTSRYLLDIPSQCLVIKKNRSLADELAQYLENRDGREEKMSEKLRAWIRPEHSLTESIQKMTDRILSEEL